MSLQVIWEEKAVSQAAGFPGDPRGLQEEHGALSAIGRSRALYQRWASHFGVDVLDGIGMTEMRHIFLSSRPGAVRPGTTGVAVPGYDPRILGGEGKQVAPGTPGHAVGARRLRRGRSRGECGEEERAVLVAA